jgi:hypothetical protein
VTDYHLRALGLAKIRLGPARYLALTASRFNSTVVYRNFNVVTTRRPIMAKGQQRKTKEAKKPKKQPAPAKLNGN